jgi:hypothetical protein
MQDGGEGVLRKGHVYEFILSEVATFFGYVLRHIKTFSMARRPCKLNSNPLHPLLPPNPKGRSNTCRVVSIIGPLTHAYVFPFTLFCGRFCFP